MRHPFDQDSDTGSTDRPADRRGGPSKPPDRALDAMAHAAERARRASSASPVSAARGRRRRRVLLSAVTMLAALGLALGLVLTMAGGPSRGGRLSTRPQAVPPATPSTATTATSGTTPPTTASGTTPPTTASGTTPSTTPSGTSPPSSTPTTAPSGGSPSGGPQLSAVVPDSGSAGDLVAITGSGLYDPNGGSVVASFGGAPSPTYCGAQDSCLVQVPDLGPAATTVPLTVTTGAGTSNAVSFSYG